jgi:hypothetical protein
MLDKTSGNEWYVFVFFWKTRTLDWQQSIHLLPCRDFRDARQIGSESITRHACTVRTHKPACFSSKPLSWLLAPKRSFSLAWYWWNRGRMYRCIPNTGENKWDYNALPCEPN